MRWFIKTILNNWLNHTTAIIKIDSDGITITLQIKILNNDKHGLQVWNPIHVSNNLRIPMQNLEIKYVTEFESQR